MIIPVSFLSDYLQYLSPFYRFPDVKVNLELGALYRNLILELLFFLFFPDLEYQLAGRGKAGIAVEGNIKGFFEELGQDIGKLPAFRNNSDSVKRKQRNVSSKLSSLCFICLYEALYGSF